MSEFKVKGKIKAFLTVESGVSKTTQKQWKKQTFILTNNEGYQGAELTYPFEVFGVEKVDNLTKYNKVGQEVEVSFRIGCNEWKDKYYTSLNAWLIKGVESKTDAPLPQPANLTQDEDTGLPF
jgi:hypothetical protein